MVTQRIFNTRLLTY